MSPILPGIVASGISGHLFTPEGSAYEIASYVVPSGGIAQVVFPVPSNYRHLQLQASYTSNNGSLDDTLMQFNGDTSSSNYTNGFHQLRGDGSSTAAQHHTGLTGALGMLPTPGTATFGSGIVDILDYNSTTKNKTVRSMSGYDSNGSGYIFYRSGNWYPPTKQAITSISIKPASGYSFSEHSTFTLIGYK